MKEKDEKVVDIKEANEPALRVVPEEKGLDLYAHRNNLENKIGQLQHRKANNEMRLDEMAIVMKSLEQENQNIDNSMTTLHGALNLIEALIQEQQQKG